MKRTVRIKLDYVVEIDDDRDGIPLTDPLDLICRGAQTIPGVQQVLPGAKHTIGLTRESWNEVRRARKAS